MADEVRNEARNEVRKEYIEREAARKFLAQDYAYAAADLLKFVPAADVVEVVRCKECKYYRKKEDSLFNDDDTCDILYYIDGSHRTACENDFCSYGERKE